VRKAVCVADDVLAFALSSCFINQGRKIGCAGASVFRNTNRGSHVRLFFQNLRVADNVCRTLSSSLMLLLLPLLLLSIVAER
jgi:hypothetical protein